MERQAELDHVWTEVLFIGGRSGVGKTSVSSEIHSQLANASVSHCVIDGDFLDMAHPAPWEHGLAERNLAAMWANYRAVGYRRLIYVNTASVMGDDPAKSGVLLRCSNEVAHVRLANREVGSTLDRHSESSSAMAERLDDSVPDWIHRVDTDGRSVTDIAAQIIELAGWTSRELSNGVGLSDQGGSGVPTS
jgi:cytidylate kinase